MQFEDYIRESLENINGTIKEVKAEQLRQIEKIDQMMDNLQSKHEISTATIAELDKRLAITESNLEAHAKTVRSLSKTALGLVLGVVTAVISYVVNLVLGK